MTMRLKDETKREAIRDATILVVNRLGLEGASISKIAKQADISAASIYTYFEDKEDMLCALYAELKGEMWRIVGKPDTLDKHGFQSTWLSMYRYVQSHPDEFRFLEQFSNSPASQSDRLKDIREQHALLSQLYQAGKQQGTLRDLPNETISAYLFAPLIQLAKLELSSDFSATDTLLNEAFEAAWRAVSPE